MTTSTFSKGRLERMHDVMAGYVERGEMPGLVTLVNRGTETHVDAIGTMAAGGSAPMRRDTIFRVSSMTKPVTAVAALILIEECVVRLDEPVDALLPELADRQVLKRIDGPIEDTEPAHRPITVRDLLLFSLGHGMVMSPGPTPVSDTIAAAGLGPGPPKPSTFSAPDDMLRRLGSLPLLHQPGEQWLYNTGSDVLGVLIVRATDQSFGDFLRERVFDPLGMVDTSFVVPADKLERLGPCYWKNHETGAAEVFDDTDGDWSVPPPFESGGGGLASTADDYLRFGRMLLDHGVLDGQRILSRGSVEAMTTDQLTAQQKATPSLVPGFWETHGWGFGVSVVTKRVSPEAPIGQFGWDGGMGTSWQCTPSEDMVTILMTPSMWESPNPPNVIRDFWTLASQAIDD